jgi:hypothetical protein
MNERAKITPSHLSRQAIVYLRQSSAPACPGERDVAARRFSTRNRPDTGPPQSPDECNLREG